MPSIQREAAARIPQQPQAQYSLDEQLEVLVVAANKLGLYDAADWLGDIGKQRALHQGPKPVHKQTPEEYRARLDEIHGPAEPITQPDCACKEKCGDVPEDQDDKLAICKGLPE